jgi:broad specificity phosphatase PhoE
MTEPDNGPLRLYLIRHGETEWTLSHQHTGRTDIPLSENGESDARILGQKLQATKFSRIFTSPRRRAQQTCALAGFGYSAIIEPDLVEWDYGDYEGRRTIDIQSDRPRWNIFKDGCPNGEMPAQVSDRADRLLSKLRKMDGNIALFSHGQFGCVLAARWIGLPVTDGPHFLLGTTALGILSYDSNHPDTPVLALWNGNSTLESDSLFYPLIDGSRTPGRRAIERWENEGGEIPDVPQQTINGTARR